MRDPYSGFHMGGCCHKHAARISVELNQEENKGPHTQPSEEHE
jgi:hypothetical protein